MGMFIAAFWIVMVSFAVLQSHIMVREGQFRELLAYAVFWIIAGTYVTLLMSDIRLLNVYEIISMTLARLYDFLGLDWM